MFYAITCTIVTCTFSPCTRAAEFVTDTIETTPGASVSQSPKGRSGEFTVPSGGITVTQGLFYGYTYDEGSDGTFQMAIFNSSNELQGSCSGTGTIVSGGSPGWNTVTWATPVPLPEGVYQLAIYPSEKIWYYYDEIPGKAFVDDDLSSSCGDVFTKSAANWIKLSVVYEATTTDVAINKFAGYELGQNYPNPFSGETVIPYSLKEAVNVTIDIYNLTGQKIKNLVHGKKQAGFHTVTWDGRNGQGKNMPGGVYFYILKSGNNKVGSCKMLMLE